MHQIHVVLGVPGPDFPPRHASAPKRPSARLFRGFPIANVLSQVTFGAKQPPAIAAADDTRCSAPRAEITGELFVTAQRHLTPGGQGLHECTIDVVKAFVAGGGARFPSSRATRAFPLAGLALSCLNRQLTEVV